MTSLPHDLAARILDGSPDAVLVCDRTGVVRYWNPAAERAFGFRQAEAVGASMDLIIPDRLRARHWAGWETAMRTGVTHYGEGQLLAVPALHKDGRQISIEFSIQLLKGVDGAVEWVVAFIRDVTDRYDRERQLRAHLANLEEKTLGLDCRHGKVAPLALAVRNVASYPITSETSLPPAASIAS